MNLRTLPILLLLLGLAACGTPQITGVVSVEIPGGDREMPLQATMVLAAVVTAGSGTSTAVTWETSEPGVAAIDGAGVLTASSAGTTTITATSLADTSKSDSMVVTVVVDLEQATSFDATYVSPDPIAPPVLGAGLLVASPEALGGTSFTELDPGIFLGPLSPVAPDGSVSVTLPAPTDVPAAVLDVVTSFLPTLDTALDCELAASAPTTLATPLIFSIITVPGVFLTTFDSGPVPALVSDSPVNPLATPPAANATVVLQSYVYADGDTTLTTTGTNCMLEGIASPLVVELDLQLGWNQLALNLDFDDLADIELLTITNSSTEELFLHPLSP